MDADLTSCSGVAAVASFELRPSQRQALHALYSPGLIVIGASALLLVLVKTHLMPDSFQYTLTGENVLFYSLFLGILVCYATLPVRPIELTLVVGLGLIAEMHPWLSHPSYTFTEHLRGVGFNSGSVALAAITWRTLVSRGDERLWAGGMLIISLIMFLFPSVSMWLHFEVELHTPVLYDAYAYKVDGTFGVQPAAAMTMLCARHEWLYDLTFLTYNELPLFMVCGVLLSLKYPERCYGKLMLHFLLIGLAGFVCYWIFPMKGVNLFCGDAFPDGRLPLVNLPTPYAEGPYYTRNCYPSLHLGWMLAIYFGVRGVNAWVQRVGLFLVVSMVAATLHPGVHYVVDLIAALPYVVAFFGLINRATDRNRNSRVMATLVGFLLFLGFSLLLFDAPMALADHPSLLAAVVVTVISGALVVEHRLFRTTVTGEAPPQTDESQQSTVYSPQ